MWKIVMIPKLTWQALTRANRNQKFQFYNIYIDLVFLGIADA